MLSCIEPVIGCLGFRRSGLLTGKGSKRTSATYTSPGTIDKAGEEGLITGALLAAGLELGLWNFCATASQALALEATTATRGAFLIQVLCRMLIASCLRPAVYVQNLKREGCWRLLPIRTVADPPLANST